MANQVIFIRKSDEKLWEQAKKSAGDTGMGAYLMRLVRRDQLHLWQKPGKTDEEKLTEAQRLIDEVRENMAAATEMQKRVEP